MRSPVPVLLAAGLALSWAGLAASATTSAASATVPTKLADTRAALRDLWLGHVFWVRNVVDARFAGDTAEATVAEAQVVANAGAIAAAIEPFYGKAASEQLLALLAGHWGAISDYLDAVHAGSKPDQDRAYEKLLANAGEIAAFLGSANPHLPVDTVRGLLTAHGAHHVQQIQQFQARQFDEETRTWTVMKDHMYVIADALADAIAQQFPARFT